MSVLANFLGGGGGVGWLSKYPKKTSEHLEGHSKPWKGPQTYLIFRGPWKKALWSQQDSKFQKKKRLQDWFFAFLGK